MNWWQISLLVIGLLGLSVLIPSLIFGYALGGVIGSGVGKGTEQTDEQGRPMTYWGGKSKGE